MDRMTKGAKTVADLRAVVDALEIRCAVCDERWTIDLDPVIAARGPDLSIPDLLRWPARGCANFNAYHGRCRLSAPDLVEILYGARS